MCFTANSIEIKIAEADIPVYKIIRNTNAPQFLVDRMDDQPGLITRYTPGQLYTDPEAMVIGEFGDGYEIEQAFHSYAEFPPHYVGWNEKIVQFTIPKGARYALGEDYISSPVYVSDQIVAGTLEPIEE